MGISGDKEAVKKQIIEHLLSMDIQINKDALLFLLAQQNPITQLTQVLKLFDKIPVVLTLEDIKSVKKDEVFHDQSIIKTEPKSDDLIISEIDEDAQKDWDFADADTQYSVHGIHLYPARMIPQIANRLIQKYSHIGETVLDPFCGSGSVLVEAKTLGRNSIGVDINFLAVLLAKVKISIFDTRELKQKSDLLMRKVREDIELFRQGQLEVRQPYFQNIFHWFKRPITLELEIIRKIIEKEENENIRNFFKVCFSSTIRQVSNIRKSDNPYFIRALHKDELAKHNPDVLTTFSKKLPDSVNRMLTYQSTNIKEVEANVLLEDTRFLSLGDDSVDLIVTSPPYGEEKNTMSYTRFAKLSLFWIGYDRRTVTRQSKKSLGSNMTHKTPSSKNLQKLLADLKSNPKRKLEVASFFSDYTKCLEQMHRILRPNRYCCIVIGNRTASGVSVSNDQITIDLSEDLGFEHVETFHREIPKKTLPRSDARGSLINRESIIILRKKHRN